MMRKLAILSFLAMAVVASGLESRTALAVAQFQRVWLDEYVKNSESKEIVEAVKKMKIKCLICHQGKKRTNHNKYGQHLVELLDKKKDAKDVAKIKAALEKVAKLHSDPKDEKSPTYGDLIEAGTLPGGTYEEASKEPEKSDDAQTPAS